MSDPEVSIVIVSWNVRELLLSCLRSIRSQVETSHEVVVVDNHSSDGTAEAVRSEFPEVRLISNGQNTGFAHANNQGWQKAKGRYIAFLNPDTEFINDPFPVLLQECSKDHVGCVGPQLVNPDRSFQSSVRRFPTFADQALVLLKLRRLQRFFPALRSYVPRRENQDVESVDQIMGAAMVFPRSVLADGGSFDEGFWIWFEEVDLCQRLHDRGLTVRYVPSATVVHHGGQSFSQHYSVAKQVWFMKSLARYAQKHWSLRARIGLYVLMPVSYMLTMLIGLIKPK